MAEQRSERLDSQRTTKKVSRRLAREHALKDYSVPERPFPGLEPVLPPEQESGVSAAPHVEDLGVDERPGTPGPVTIEPAEAQSDDASPMSDYFRESDPRFTEGNVEYGEGGNKVASQFPLTEDRTARRAEVIESTSTDFDPKDHTVDEVKAHVNENPNVDLARLQSLEEGEGGKNRQGLVHWLEEHTK
jgi:hypothetical protein